MAESQKNRSPAQGIEGVLLAHKQRIIRFLKVRGADEAAEDLFQDLWVKLTTRHSAPIADPLSYVMRSANNLMLDYYRAERQLKLREKAWGELSPNQSFSSEASLISREQLVAVEDIIDGMGERPARIFRLFRIDGLPQRQIAAELGVSLSTVESDLRKAYAALVSHRRQFDGQ